MFASGRHDDKETLETEVMHIRQTSLLPPRPRPLRDIDAVLGNDLLIRLGRVFVNRDFAANIEPISSGDLRHRQLLNKAGHRRGNTPIGHHNTSKRCYGGAPLKCDQ
jgi:hypothetical protein